MDNWNKYLALILALTALISLANASERADASLSCVDDEGNPVDWAIVYKFPTLYKQPMPFNSGWAYASLTSEDIKEATGQAQLSTARRQTRLSKSDPATGNLNWDISDKLLTDPTSLIQMTLEPVFGSRAGSPSLSSIFYSDQPPTKTKPSSRRGHAKGVLLMDEQTDSGLWLVHTVPRFPAPRSEPLAFLPSSKVYGQTFMCVTFNLNEAGQQIINHLINLRPYVYDAHLSPKIQQIWPQTARLQVDALKGTRLRGSGLPQMAQVVTSRGGEQLSLFSQSGEAYSDMFVWLNKELQANLYVETWRNGVGGALNSSCPNNNFHVNNVKGLKVDTGDGRRIEWSYSKDHSKWAITDSVQSGYVCLSDINRVASQFKRGGGSICMRCPGCWHLFSKSILEVEPCNLHGNGAANNRTSLMEDEEADSSYDLGEEKENELELD